MVHVMQVCQLRGQVESLSRCNSRAGSVLSCELTGAEPECLTTSAAAARMRLRVHIIFVSTYDNLVVAHSRSCSISAEGDSVMVQQKAPERVVG